MPTTDATLSAPVTPRRLRNERAIDRFLPIAATLRTYDAQKARGDLVAGLTVALFTIPQAMAYALIAGFPPVMGIFAAVAASILGAAFGSSEFLINGPTNAISVVLAANVALIVSNGQPFMMVFLLTLMIGLIQLLASAFKLGSFTRFVSEPVLTGFTAGAGIYIAVNQLPALLGHDRAMLARSLVIGGWTPPSSAVFDLLRSVINLGDTNGIALATGASAFFIVRGAQWLERRVGRRLPAPFIAVLVVTAVTYLLGLGEATAGPDKLRLVRDIQVVRRALPTLFIRGFDLDDVRALIGPAIAIGTLGAVEAIAIGKSLAASAGHAFDANRQLVGEGVCNVGAAFFGGFASSGSFSRTAVNYDSGAQTRLSCVFSGVMILGILMLFAPAANHIPVAALAGTLIHIGLRLVNVGKMRLALQTTLSDRVVLLTTFIGVLVLSHLEEALFAGIIVALLLALRRAEHFNLVRLEESEDGELIEATGPLDPADRVVTLDLQGELFFAAADELVHRLTVLTEDGPRFVVVRMTQAYNMDATCAEGLAHAAKHIRARGGRLILTGVRPGMYTALRRAGLLGAFGEDAVFQIQPAILASTRKAIAFAHACAAASSVEGDEAPASA